MDEFFIVINCRPLDAENLASSDTVVDSEHDDDPERIISQSHEQFLELGFVVIACHVLYRFGAVGLVTRVERNDSFLHCVLEGKVEQVVMLLSRTTRQPFFEEVVVVGVQFVAGYILDRYLVFFEVGVKPCFDHSLIRAVCCRCDVVRLWYL